MRETKRYEIYCQSYKDFRPSLLVRLWNLIGLVSSYNIYFNNVNSRGFTWHYFKVFLELNVFLDDTLSEWHRLYDGKPNQGFVYNDSILFHK